MSRMSKTVARAGSRRAPSICGGGAGTGTAAVVWMRWRGTTSSLGKALVTSGSRSVIR